ncbi:MAG TPA: hypothetical protein VJ692_00920, partial [Nitrospiraceae bacterium]|nr:hypothetical protein [Nitrospiraceae bacterium]
MNHYVIGVCGTHHFIHVHSFCTFDFLYVRTPQFPAPDILHLQARSAPTVRYQAIVGGSNAEVNFV